MSIGESGIKFAAGAVIAFVGCGIYKMIKKGNEPITATYDCISVAWRHEIEILRKETVIKHGWEVPKNAVVIDTRWAYKDTKKVPDGVDDNGEIEYSEESEYATWYTYRTEDYVRDNIKSASGSCNFMGDTMTCPYDPEVHLDSEDMKIGKKTRSYTGTFRDVDTGAIKTFELTREVWDNIRPGVKVQITTTKWNPNTVKSINII